MKTLYFKTQYLYGKDAFFLYEPFEVSDEHTIKADHNGVIHTVLFEGGQVTNTVLNRGIVKSFKPDANNLLMSDYVPRFVSAHTDWVFDGKMHFHNKCEVLLQKRGSYTMLKCCDCKQESPLAINSFFLSNGFDADFHVHCNPKLF